MRKTSLMLLATAAIGLATSQALAADLPRKAAPPPPPPAPIYNWTGFYVGFNGGYGWAKSDVDAVPFASVGVATAVVPGAQFSPNLNGAVFGAQLGYNYQFASNWVLGVEGDFDGAGINNSAAGVFKDPLGGAGGNATDGLMVAANIQWLATIRGRLGYTWGPSLLYITGGGAWEHIKLNALLSTDTLAAVFSTSSTGEVSKTRGGWVAGIGYEYMLTPSWIARAEYLHYGFSDSDTLTVPASCGTLGPTASCGVNLSSSNNHIDVVRLGLSYKFGWAGL